MSFWVEHGLHLALVAVPSSAMGIGLAVERRKGRQQRRAALGPPVAAFGPPVAAFGPPVAAAVADQPPRAPVFHPFALPVVAVSAVGAALVHLVVMPEHFEESYLYGMFFLSAAILQMLWATAVTYRPTRSTLIAGAAGCAATIVLYFFSRTFGIPVALGGLDGGAPETFGALDLLATAFEATAVLGVVVALRSSALGGGTPAAWPKVAKAMAMTALCGTAVVAFWAPVS